MPFRFYFCPVHIEKVFMHEIFGKSKDLGESFTDKLYEDLDSRVSSEDQILI